jgi:hypothetical protein
MLLVKNTNNGKRTPTTAENRQTHLGIVFHSSKNLLQHWGNKAISL